MSESDARREDWNRPDNTVYRVEAEMLSRDAANILRELIDDNVDCTLTAFDEREVDDDA